MESLEIGGALIKSLERCYKHRLYIILYRIIELIGGERYLGVLDHLRRKIDQESLRSWSRERAPYGRRAILEAIAEGINSIRRVFTE